MMHPLVVMVLLVPAAFAQAAVLDDASGDTTGRLPSGDSVPVPAGRGLLDLVSLAVEETADSILIHLAVASFDQSEAGDSAEFVVAFAFETTEFGLLADITTEAAGGGARSSLCRRPLGGEIWGDCIGAPVSVAPGKPGVITFTVNRGNMTNEYGLPLVAGSKLTGFWVSSGEYWNRRSIVGGTPTLGSVAWLSDNMPDSLEGAGEFVLAMGGEGAPELQLTTLRPYRSSNGEEATFVYDVAATNRGEIRREVALTVGEVPPGWAVTVGSEALRIEPGETRRFPVIVAIPFRHEHGELFTFDLETRDLASGDEEGVLKLGVRFLDVPQPSGHHPTLYLHTARPQFTAVEGYGEGFSVGPYVSTMSTDDMDTGSQIGPTSADDYRAPQVFRWCIWMSTPLQLGLDFQTGGVGEFTAVMTSGLPFSGPLTGRLLARVAPGEQSEGRSPCRPDVDMVVLADLHATDISLPGDGATQDLQMEIEPALDVLPYLSGRLFVVEFLMPLDGPALPLTGIFTDFPRFMPGASMELPLEEYHDPPPASSQSETHIVSDSASRVYRNPGATAVFNFTFTAPTGRFELAILGTKPEWARLEPSVVRGGDTFHLIVAVPEDDSDGSIADLIVKAVDQKSGEIALAHAVVEVDNDAEHPDDQQRARTLGASKQSPAISAVVMCAALVLLAACRRALP